MALDPGSVHCIIPTRGDVDDGLALITAHLKTFPEIGPIDVVVGNTPWNRYARAMESPLDIIYVQDDDAITDIRPLLDAFVPGEGVMVNAMTRAHAEEYKDSRFTLCGFGAIFDKSMLSVFDGYERDALFFRESDRIMGSVPHRTVYPKIFIPAYASAPNRTYRQRGHCQARRDMEARILAKQ